MQWFFTQHQKRGQQKILPSCQASRIKLEGKESNGKKYLSLLQLGGTSREISL